jgi:hypothetical protein
LLNLILSKGMKKRIVLALAVILFAAVSGVSAQDQSNYCDSVKDYHGSVIKNVSMWTLEIISGSYESEATEFALNGKSWRLGPGSSMFFDENIEVTFNIEATKGWEKKNFAITLQPGEDMIIDQKYIMEWGE